MLIQLERAGSEYKNFTQKLDFRILLENKRFNYRFIYS